MREVEIESKLSLHLSLPAFFAWQAASHEGMLLYPHFQRKAPGRSVHLLPNCKALFFSPRPIPDTFVKYKEVLR